ncbi:MAG: CoA pyrophosphatase [Anaerolineae bacterium]|nr:CoA pyrophosphatase [Anaerolineae bacterium]
MRMAPAMRQSRPGPGDHPRSSAVLALLHTTPHGLSLVFTLRPLSLRRHGGQISFPGGGAEPGDLTYADAALRETEEELGISTHDIEILGEMTPLFIAPSQNIVHHFVGWLAVLPPLDPDPFEVESVLQVPLNALLDPRSLDTHYWPRDGVMLSAPCYRVGETCIWGATAMMLSELLEIIRRLHP